MRLGDIVSFLDRELDVANVKDKSRNGLQVQGPEEVTKVALAVDACRASFVAARAAGAELLVVHHGLFWGDVEGLRGVLYERIRYLVENGLGLYCAHLPLDLHPTLGNNAVLCDILEVEDRRGFAKVQGRTIGFRGRLRTPMAPAEVGRRLGERLGGRPVVLPGRVDVCRTVGVVSGGGGGDFWEALECGLDCFVTGETCYSVFHDAVESGTAVVFAGHYETEVTGPSALGRHIEEKLGLPTVFVDLPAPGY